MQPDYLAASAPNGQGTPDAVLPAAAPSGMTPGAPPAVQMTKEQRDALAQMGRRTAAAERAAEAANRRAEQAAQAAQAANRRLQERDQADTDAYLNSLPPDQRAVAAAQLEARAARQEVAALQQRMQQPAPARPAPQMSPEQQQERAHQLLEHIAQETGVRLSGTEDALDWRGEREFYTSARTIALMRRSGTPDAAASAADQTESASVVASPVAQYDYSAARPLSPAPQGGVGRVTEGDLDRTMWMKNPIARRKALTEQRGAAFRQAGVELSP